MELVLSSLSERLPRSRRATFALGTAIGTTLGILAALSSSPARADEFDPAPRLETTAPAALPFGPPVSEQALAANRGGDVQVNENRLRATLGDNSASNLSTGMNAISEGSFGQASGFPMVIQNSGNNVIIQNSTILNLTVK